MRNHVGMMLFIFAIAMFIMVPELLESIFALLFIGIVPVTGYIIPTGVMLLIYGALLTVAIYAITHQHAVVANKTRREAASREMARKKVLKTVKLTSSKKKTSTSKKSTKKLQVVKEN